MKKNQLKKGTKLKIETDREITLGCKVHYQLTVENPNFVKCSKCSKFHTKSNIIPTYFEHTLIATNGKDEKVIETKRTDKGCSYCTNCIYEITLDEFPEIIVPVEI